MKRMTYATLMKKVEEGKMEVTAWATHYVGYDLLAEVTIYPANINARPKRCHVEVTKVPEGVR